MFLLFENSFYFGKRQDIINSIKVLSLLLFAGERDKIMIMPYVVLMDLKFIF